jgi:hypothetical protein
MLQAVEVGGDYMGEVCIVVGCARYRETFYLGIVDEGRRRDPPPRGAAWEPLGVKHLESQEISQTKGP